MKMLIYLEKVLSLCVQYMCTTNYKKSVQLTLNITSASILFFSSLLLLLVRVTLFMHNGSSKFFQKLRGLIIWP